MAAHISGTAAAPYINIAAHQRWLLGRAIMTTVGLAIFDLDDTLLDRKALLRRWAADWAAAHHLGPAEVQWLVTADGDGFVPRPLFFASVRDRYGLHSSVERLIEQYWERTLELVEPIPTEVNAALHGLRSAGWRVAIATNGPVRGQLGKMRRCGLDTSVDAIAISEGVGAAKPDARMFAAAARRCGRQLTDGGWVVGDCPSRDVDGGRAVGLRTVWLSHGRPWEASLMPPDVTVDSIVDAVAVMLSH